MEEEVRGQAQGAAAKTANTDRRSQIGSGQRGDKRRTYRFRDDAVADHVTGKTARCAEIMRGNFDKLWP